MMENTPPRQLPVRLPPYPDELLSSWIGRHAAFYAVPALVMLRHCLPETSSLRAADLHLSSDQEIRLARMFAIEPAAVRRMTFTDVDQSSRRLIAARPLQSCPNCTSRHKDPKPILRSQLLGWRITCPMCGASFQNSGATDQVPSPIREYHSAALQGEKMLDNEAERGIRRWTSPTDIARLLLMRRIPRPIPRVIDLWRFRVLGAIVPDFDDIVAAESDKLPTPASPILPLRLRTALLAGVAIVERAGPKILWMLRGHMMGANRMRFSSLADTMTAQAHGPEGTSSQMQLI